jgi:threonine dehydrogenase-like Zn-dependent dehydrogenase
VICADASRGIIDRVGTEVTNLKVGDRVVVSFNIACGTCKFCQMKYSSMCEYTNNSSMMEQMYGQRDGGFFGYGHLSVSLSPHPISHEPVLTMRFLEGMRAFSTK